MKLGKQTANITNWLMAQQKHPAPFVGMGVTVLMWTDRYAGTIIALKGKATVIVQRDKAIRTDKNGTCETQEYRYEADPKGSQWVFRKIKNGRYKEVNGSVYLSLGVRDEYFDYSF